MPNWWSSLEVLGIYEILRNYIWSFALHLGITFIIDARPWNYNFKVWFRGISMIHSQQKPSSSHQAVTEPRQLNIKPAFIGAGVSMTILFSFRACQYHFTGHFITSVSGYPLASVSQRIQWHSSKEFQQTAAVARDLGSVDQITRSTSWCQHVSWMKSQRAGKSAEVAMVTVLWFALIDLLALGILTSICFHCSKIWVCFKRTCWEHRKACCGCCGCGGCSGCCYFRLVPDSVSMYCLHRPSPISANLVR